MLIGTDTHHARSDEEAKSGEFQIWKATEGSTFIDSRFSQLLKKPNIFKAKPKLFGAYHFLSEKSGIAEQIEHFIKTVEPLKGSVMLILDYEAEFSKNDPRGKCLHDAIQQMRFLVKGAQYVIYMNKSDARKINMYQYNTIEKACDTCLWIADYKGDYGGNWKPIMRQVCTSPCDIDVFYGSEVSWRMIAQSWN